LGKSRREVRFRNNLAGAVEQARELRRPFRPPQNEASMLQNGPFPAPLGASQHLAPLHYHIKVISATETQEFPGAAGFIPSSPQCRSKAPFSEDFDDSTMKQEVQGSGIARKGMPRWKSARVRQLMVVNHRSSARKTADKWQIAEAAVPCGLAWRLKVADRQRRLIPAIPANGGAAAGHG
jgi:hypothetical protein